MTVALRVALLALQLFQTLFLILHDWVPLGRFTNLAAVRAADSFNRRLLTTVISGIAFAIGLGFSLYHANDFRFPYWLHAWLWISYGILLAGELRAWWVPYWTGGDAERIARYKQRFAGTHRFLPTRYGIAPDTLHVILHATTLMTLVVLALGADGQ